MSPWSTTADFFQMISLVIVPENISSGKKVQGTAKLILTQKITVDEQQ